jgi:hypothetical protein
MHAVLIACQATAWGRFVPDDLMEESTPAPKKADVPAPSDELLFEPVEGIDPNIDQGLISGTQQYFLKTLATARAEKKLR